MSISGSQVKHAFCQQPKQCRKNKLPIVTKPLIQYGVEEAMSAMINDMAFVTRKNKRAIEDHFDINYELENLISGTEKKKFDRKHAEPYK